MFKRCAALLAAGAAVAAKPAGSEVLLVANDYDSPVYVAAGISGSATADALEAASAGAWNAAGWAGEYVVNRTTGNPATMSLLMLNGLAPNSAVRIGSGILGFLESWDSSDGGGGYSPDYLDVFINGSLVASLTTNTALGTVEEYDGGTVLFDGVQANGNFYYSDTLVDISTAAFANSMATAAGTWSLAFQARGAGWQGDGDEGWGLDDWAIYGTVANAAPVPEPASWALMIGGFALAGGMLRNRRRDALRVRMA